MNYQFFAIDVPQNAVSGQILPLVNGLGQQATAWIASQQAQLSTAGQKLSISGFETRQVGQVLLLAVAWGAV